ncbi:MAG: hypothetical protein KF858_09205, partial [Candidatus Sumerlaeia bacterium]|nr:hypothetical protein [Candidatus Sumerlaeia bacterium]
MTPRRMPSGWGTAFVAIAAFAVGDGGLLSGILSGAAWDGIKSLGGPILRRTFATGLAAPNSDLHAALGRATGKVVRHAQKTCQDLPEQYDRLSTAEQKLIDSFFAEFSTKSVIAYNPADLQELVELSDDDALRNLREVLRDDLLFDYPESFRDF